MISSLFSNEEIIALRAHFSEMSSSEFQIVKSKTARRKRDDISTDKLKRLITDIGFYLKLSDTLVRCWTKEIPLNKRFARSGIILHADIEGSRYWLMAVDATYNQLTDFSGGVKKEEFWLEAAVRELWEESYGIFDYRSQESMEYIYQNSVAVHDDINTIIISQKIVCSDPEYICELFDKRMRESNERVENSRIAWVPDSIFRQLFSVSQLDIKTEKMHYPSIYERIRDPIGQCGGILDPKMQLDSLVIER